MENKCNIPRKDINSAPTQAELMNFADEVIMPYLLEIFDNDDYYYNDVLSPTKVKLSVISFLQSLGNTHTPSDHKYIAQAMSLALEDPAYKFLKQLIPPGSIIDILQAKGTAEDVNARIFTDRIEDDNESEYDAVNYFIYNAYGAATEARTQLERKMTNVVINSFIVNREQGTIVSNIKEALHNIEYYKRKLLLDIQNFFKVHNIQSSFTTADLESKSVSDLIQLYKKDISEYLTVGVLSTSDIQTLYDEAYNNSTTANIKQKSRTKLDAYGAWLALQHFDNFIKMSLGDTIIINPASPERYAYSNKGTNVNTTWRKDDNIDLEAEVNKLTQALINTSPMFQFGSSTPISGSYMQFSDFSYITSKIKDLAFDQSASITFIDKNKLLMDALTEDEQQLVKFKSFRHIISSTRYNPQKYIPIVFKLLNAKTEGGYFADKFRQFNKQDRNILWSVYKTIYDSNFNGLGQDANFHSLYAIQKENPDSKNYYAAVSSVADCIFSVDFVQYTFDNGVLKLRTLRDAAVDKTRREIENVINTKNSSKLTQNFDFSKYNLIPLDTEGEPLTDEGTFGGISFRLTLDDVKNDYLYIHVKDMGESITISKQSSTDGQNVSNEELKALEGNQSIVEFFDEILGLNISSDAALRNTFKELTKEGNDDVAPYLTQLLKYSSHVFMNRYFAQTYLSDKVFKKGKVGVIRKYFKDEASRPRFNNTFFNMEMTPRKKYDTLLTLSQALGTTRGINSSRQVKDSDNAALSSQTLSRLLGNLVQQLDIQINSYNRLKEKQQQLDTYKREYNDPITNVNRKTILETRMNELVSDIELIKSTSYLLDTTQYPAAAHFDLIQNPELFKGALKSEEIKGLYGSKKQVKFTTAEAVLSSFLHNFVLGHCDPQVLDRNTEFGGGVVGLLPSVNSDKNTVSTAKFDLKAKVKNLPDRTYLSLTNPELQTVIRTEIGEFYRTMFNNIKDDFRKLQYYSESFGISIDPETNFTELNDYVDNYNSTLENGELKITALGELFRLTAEYNKLHTQNPIRLIDQIHYVVDGNHIKRNNTIQSLINRFTDEQNTKEFFDLKNTEVLKSALDSGFIVNLYGNTTLDNQPEVNYLRENYKEWINKSGQMVLAKVDVLGQQYTIVTKNDLFKLEELLTLEAMIKSGQASNLEQAVMLYEQNSDNLKSKYGFNNLINKTYLLKNYIQLHPMLERYNLMDYLFTQEFMLSTVGSHVAHPAKTKNKTSIIWAHPGIGKSYVVENTKYKNRIMDWDVEFNARRDVWIAQQTNTQIGTPEFKNAKTDYQVNWKDKPDFIEFVGKEWNRIKRKANNENKILVVSPHMLLELFGQDFNKVLTLGEQDFIDRNVQRGATKKNSKLWKQGIDQTLLVYGTNPVFNSKIKEIPVGTYLSNLLEQGYLNEELTQLIRNEMQEEASRFYAQHKRNVSFTAAMDQFQLNQIEGIPLWYNIAIIDDIREDVFTIDGNTDSSKPFDGATFVNPYIVYLENNSLNEARAGVDKKQFVHYYDELTGSGGIIKTAGFAITNDRMRNSLFYRYMNKNMTNKIWKDYTGTEYIADITKNFKGQDVNYGEFYFKQGNKYYKATIQKAQEPNSYIRNTVEVTEDGQTIGNVDKQLFTDINTNYKLWEMFGGMHSQEFNGGVLKPSETSIQNVVKAMINVGELKPNYKEGDITAENIDQPLKNADIHYMPTIGAVKQGAANINPQSYYEGEQDLNFFRIRMTNAGIQLDKEHHADDSKLSLMTQVISAACSMGYTPKQATKLYKALHNLTMQGIKEFKDSFQELLQYPESSKFETVIADCMIKNLLTSTAQDGDMLKAIAEELIVKVRQGKSLNAEDAKSIPYSDPAVFEKLVSNLSVIMTKSGIKAKMSGILSVLCPTQNIVKMYRFTDEKGNKRTLTLSQLEELYGDSYENIIDNIQRNQFTEFVGPDYDMTNIEIGSKYLVELQDGSSVVMNVKVPHNVRYVHGNEEVIGYQAFKELIRNGKISTIQEYIKDGSELKSINFKFKGMDGQNYQLWDIDFIQDLYTLTQKSKKLETDEEKLSLYLDLITKYDGNLDKLNQSTRQMFRLYSNGGAVSTAHKLTIAKRYISQLQQQILFALSKNNPNKNFTVKIEGRDVNIDKNSIVTDAYELVMPKTFLKEFGLDNYANLDEILRNPNYFYDKMKKNFATKVLDETHYDLELKVVSGDHIYLKDKSGLQPGWNRDLEKVIIHTKVDDLGRIWRIDLSTNKRMYQLFSSNDEVYRIPGTDTEIIVTETVHQQSEDGNTTTNSGLTFYLNQFKYNSLHISEAIAAGERTSLSERPMFDDMLNLIKTSTNTCAQSWVSLFTGDVSSEVKQDKQGWNKDRVEFNKDLNNFDKLGEKFKKFLNHQARIIHTSLQKSLEVIAARIPAQNQQSFMPMRVVAWENPNINTAYVSVMQFFLQGSDLDIDAVSLLTYSFNKNGEFYKWSPDFNFNDKSLLDLSLSLPFPSGEKLKVVIYENEELVGVHTNEADKKIPITKNEHFIALVQANQEKGVKLQQDEEQQRQQELLKHYIALLEFIEDSNGTIYFDKNSEYQDKQAQKLIKRIDKHNTYLSKANDKEIEGAIKNYMVSALLAISSDSANMIEAHTGVDVATGPFKAIANKSALSEVQKTFTPGNVFNKFQAIEEASVGKDDIAICATGLKSFFASTQFCNSYLNKNIQNENLSQATIDELTSIIKFDPVTIGGKTFNTLANIRVDDLTKVNPDSEIYKTLLDKGFDQDASVIMSALLSLSTDNAKELCLAKINAGTGMIGMYLYGAAIGMDFEVLNKIIASPLGFTVAKLLNNNEFTQQRGKQTVDTALTYLYFGPQRSDLNRFKARIYDSKSKSYNNTFGLFEESLKELLTEDNDLLETFTTITGDADIAKTVQISSIGKILAELVHTNGAQEAYSLLDRINEKVNKKISSFENNFKDNPSKVLNFKALNNQMHNFLMEFVEQTSTLNNTDYTTEYGISNIAEDLNKLVLGADEFKRLGQLLRLNQEIKTKSGDLISFVNKIEQCLKDRTTIIKNTNKRLGIKSKDGINSVKNFDFKLFAESFLLNPGDPNAYHNQQIQTYEEFCKTCVNPLRILTSVDHYQGYLTAMILAYEGDYTKSVKFRAIKHLGNNFIRDYKVQSPSAITSVYKGVQTFVDEYMNNAYLSTQELLHIPRHSEENPVYIIDENGNKHDNVYNNTYIQLGTENGNKTFESFFENIFITELKNQYKGNLFVDELKPVLITDSVTGNQDLAISLSVNMMPTSDNERMLFNRYKNGFNQIAGKLVTIDNINYSIVEMFHYYNLLKFRGKAGRNSLLKIFEDILSKDPRLKAYRIFINDFDNTYDFIIAGTNEEITSDKVLIPVEEDVLARYLAPLSTPHAATANMIKYRDANVGETVLLKKKPEQKQTDEMYDGEMGDMLQDMYQEDMGEYQDDSLSSFEEGLDIDQDSFDQDEYSPDYGDFELVDGDGVLARFNPPSLKIEDKYDRIIPSYKNNDTIVKNIVISEGKVKQLQYNNEIIDIDSKVKVVKIVKQQNQEEQYVIDENKLNSIIENLKCGE